MTPDQLNDALDAMEAAAGDDQDKRSGLIEVATDRWIGRLDALQTAKPKTLVDGIRVRDIKVAVVSGYTTRVLTRAEAGERGEPFRDLTPKTE